jgi:hypothetical protein
LEDSVSQEFVPQRPVDIITYLKKEVFPAINVYQRARVIRNYTAGRSKVHSHEIELAVIRDVNKSLREKFLEVLIKIVEQHIKALRRTIENEGYLSNIDTILTQFELESIRTYDMFDEFIGTLQNQLKEACEVMAEMAIKKLDEVGVYNESLNYVASLPCSTMEECKEKQEELIEYLQDEYNQHLTVAFKTLSEEGWDELSEKIAKNRENLVGLLGSHDVITAKIFEERQFMKRKGAAIQDALFEVVQEALREKMAVLRKVEKEDHELRATKKNAEASQYKQRLQLIEHQCKELLSQANDTKNLH